MGTAFGSLSALLVAFASHVRSRSVAFVCAGRFQQFTISCVSACSVVFGHYPWSLSVCPSLVSCIFSIEVSI
jgi:hypothetical protein